MAFGPGKKAQHIDIGLIWEALQVGPPSPPLGALPSTPAEPARPNRSVQVAIILRQFFCKCLEEKERPKFSLSSVPSLVELTSHKGRRQKFSIKQSSNLDFPKKNQENTLGKMRFWSFLFSLIIFSLYLVMAKDEETDEKEKAADRRDGRLSMSQNEKKWFF